VPFAAYAARVLRSELRHGPGLVIDGHDVAGELLALLAAEDEEAIAFRIVHPGRSIDRGSPAPSRRWSASATQPSLPARRKQLALAGPAGESFGRLHEVQRVRKQLPYDIPFGFGIRPIQSPYRDHRRSTRSCGR